MTNFIKNFAANESGAVTVDWVVLTAALVGLGLAVMAVVSGGIEDLSSNISDSMTGITLQDGFTDGALTTNLAQPEG
jgi:Flp pilus assembly pilin Flp